MNSPTPTFSLDPYHQARLDLWHSASIELSIGPEGADPLVQAKTSLTCVEAGSLGEVVDTPHLVHASGLGEQESGKL